MHGTDDFEARSEEQFKKHLGIAHELNAGGFTKVSYSQPKKLCIQWNRGHCTFDTKCRFAHEEMVACNFAEGCSRMECKFWHAASTGKFPFLEHGRRQVGPNRSRRLYQN